MKFKRTYSTLKNLEQNPDVALVDVLGIFQDICNDLEEEQDQTLDELEIGNEKNLVGKLLWIGQELVSVFKANKDGIMNPSQAAKIAKQEAKLETEIKNLEIIQGDVRLLLEQEEKLLAIQKEKEEVNRQKQRLLKECNRLEQENDQCETVTLVQLERKISAMEQKKIQLAVEYKEKVNAYVEQESEANRILEEKNKIIKSITALEWDLSNIRKTIDGKKREIERMEDEKLHLSADLDVLNSRISSLDSQKKEYIEKINTLDENMRTMNIEVLRKRYEEKAKAYAELEQEANRIAGEEKAVVTNAQNLKNSIAGLEAYIKEQQSVIIDLQQQKDTLITQAQSAKLQKDQLEEWFKGMEYQTYEEETKQLNKRLDVLIQAREALCRAMDKGFFMVDDDAEKQMRAFRENLEMTLQKIQDELDSLQRKYIIVSKAIYGEGESLL
ncbi:MAG: hypothetical protein U0L12_07500 [Ruminococcus sp.]|nr:hypothetical protein [Ruminococcus sp.]